MDLKSFFLVSIVVGLIPSDATSKETVLQKLLQKRVATAAPRTRFGSYSNDVNECLFDGWTAGKSNPTPVLSEAVQCAGTKLCYSPPSPAQFAVCYNTVTFIPEFTGHVVKSNIVKNNVFRKTWHVDNSLSIAKISQATKDDYDAAQEIKDYPSWDVNNDYFCSKGHLSPSADFETNDDCKMAYILTNAAPQWQKFNEGNWAALEDSVRKYAEKKGTDVYVFTGTGGQAKDANGADIMLKKKVVVPKWYWKAVCDPIAKESIVFVAQNNVGDKSKADVNKCGIDQTSERGVILCYSLEDARKVADYSDFKLPPFDKTNCQPSIKGANFMAEFQLIMSMLK